MAEDKNDHRDLESGDNPQERKKTSNRVEKKQIEKGNEQKDLESGDNPEERDRNQS